MIARSKLSNKFLVHPEYKIIKIIPNNSIRNYSSTKIAKAINTMYRGFINSINVSDKTYNVPPKVSYMIYFTDKEISFFFIVPKEYYSLIKEKITSTWNDITIKIVNELPGFDSPDIYQLRYKKEDAFSLATDLRSNVLLSKILNVVSIMKDDDKAAVFYNFMPLNNYSWKADHENIIKKYNEGYPVEKEKISLMFIFKLIAVLLCEVIDIIVESLIGNSDLKDSLKSRFKAELSPSTTKKCFDEILGVQVVALSESNDNIRRRNNAIAICESFKCISEDNELNYKKVKFTFKPKNMRLPVEVNKMSSKECQNLISLPGRELLQEYKIEHINTLENEVPEELREGVISTGTNTYKGKEQKAYLTTDREYKNLTLNIIGPTRAGKTTLITNMSKDSVNGGECTIIFDFCGNCELSNEVIKAIPKNKVLDIDCEKNIQGLGYNEIKPNADVFKSYRNAKVQTLQLLTLVNSINANDKNLSVKMDRYLEAAALIVFISNGSIKDVFDVLQNYKKRHMFIDKIPSIQKNNLDEYVNYLYEIDDKDQSTKLGHIRGILDRINKLKQNPYMELMLKRDCNNNIDLAREIQKSQLICIKMPEIMFSTQSEKDIYCTYWITKIWLALQLRKWEISKENHVKVNIIVDELYQVPHTQEFIRSKLSQMAKFTAKMIISCHYLGQIPIIRNELKAANSSYMLLSGCDKDNYKELKEELHPFELDDLLNLKRYHSLNLLKYENGWAKFITKLPSPI